MNALSWFSEFREDSFFHLHMKNINISFFVIAKSLDSASNRSILSRSKCLFCFIFFRIRILSEKKSQSHIVMSLNNCRRQTCIYVQVKMVWTHAFTFVSYPKTQNRGKSLEPTWFIELSQNSGIGGTRHLWMCVCVRGQIR